MLIFTHSLTNFQAGPECDYIRVKSSFPEKYSSKKS